MGISNGLNKNINIPFLGIGIVVAVGLIWAAANFLNIKSGAILQNSNIAPVEFDVAVLEADRQGLTAAESDTSSLKEDDVLFKEIDQASDDISGLSDTALDEKSLIDEASLADISGDLSAFDAEVIQNEIDQSINDVVQY